MGRILEYVLLLSNLSLVLALQSKNVSVANNEREIQDNFTLALRQYLPKDQNESFSKRALGMPLGPPIRKRPPARPNQMSKSLGLNAFAVKDPAPRNRRRNLGPEWRKNPFPPFNQTSSYGKTFRNYHPPPQKERAARLPPNFKQSNAVNHNNDDSNQRRHYKDWRNARFNNQRHSPKVCDPCNSVPWTPIIKGHGSYREQRTHDAEFQTLPSQELNLDFHGYASDTHSVLLPSSPLVPPLEPIYDGTISSSLGLPVGNIPTGHGLLAPLNHLATKINHYGTGSLDYSNSLQLFPTQAVLESNPIPQLSPVPVVPIHDSGQFYQVDTSISDLVPPLQPTKPVDVSNVVLTISEDNHGKLNPDSIKLHTINGKDLSSASSAQVSYSNEEQYPPLQNIHTNIQNIQSLQTNFGKLEIVKSIPLIEFTSTVNYPQPPVQQIPSAIPTQVNYLQTNLQAPTAVPTQISYVQPKLQPPSPVPPHINYPQPGLQVPSAVPPLQFHLAAVPSTPLYKTDYRTQKDVSDSENSASFNFLVPPPAKKTESDTIFNKSKNGVLPFLNPPKKSDVEPVKSSTVPRPLTSPSLSWLFSDTSIQSTTAKTTEQFATGSHEIAAIVNNELRPVSPQALPLASSNSDTSKSKKIQIIIPYTTKNKNGQDNNALESVHREVFQTIQPPVSISNNSSRDSATSALPPPVGRVHQHLTQNKKAIDPNSNHLSQSETGDKFISEMHHIIATNIRELLREEIEKTQTDQNYPLQNNIDNWTALEYSNHKTIGSKAPKEIINQAQAVTSIPGTSISHLLLPSKKIPNEYFVTTPLPVFDEPSTLVFKARNVTVDSKPFTAKPYATTNLYIPTKTLKLSTHNHEPNYTNIAKERVNTWGRLNENLVLPEAKTVVARKVEEGTPASWSNGYFGSSVKDKVEIVTPVSSSITKQNYTTYVYRRTTRQVHSTEPTVIKTTSTSTTSNRLNSTKLEKLSNATFAKKPTFRFVNTTTIRQAQGPSASVKIKPALNKTEESVAKNKTSPTNITSEELFNFSKTNKSELNSINDVFPFRNKELPWESSSNASDASFQNGRQRKSLIKQTKSLKSKSTANSS